jgi:hypothetical protein
MKKLILHLCADIGSDSRFYQLDNDYEVILIGEKIGVENYYPPDNVYGIIANPVCTEFSTASGFDKVKDIDKGMFLVNHCLRIINKAKPVFWVMENPANGRLREILGAPFATYQPWQYGSPWTKKTALWGNFKMPEPLFKNWGEVTKNDKLYTKPKRNKPALADMHKSAIEHIHEFEFAKDKIKTDADFRSLCSQGFANEFYKENK